MNLADNIICLFNRYWDNIVIVKYFRQDNHLLKIWCSYSPNSVLYHCICHWLRRSKNSLPKNDSSVIVNSLPCHSKLSWYGQKLFFKIFFFVFYRKQIICCRFGMTWERLTISLESLWIYLAFSALSILRTSLTIYNKLHPIRGKNIYRLTVDELVSPSKRAAVLFCPAV